MSATTASKPGPRTNARDKVARDNQIVAARMRGLSWVNIASTHGLSERQCQTIVAQYRDSHPRLRERDPVELVDDLLDRLEGAQEELAEISATSKHDATRVGAIRTRLDALNSQANLLTMIGVLPRDLGRLRDDIDARFIARQLVGILSRYGVSDEAQQALLEALGTRKNGTQ